MKKIPLTLFATFSLFACQPAKINNTKVEPIPKEIIVATADEVLASLNNCYDEISCKLGLDEPISNWLIEKGYLTEDIQVATDEVDSQQGLRDTKPVKKIRLSSNYMNNALVKGALNEWLTWKRPQLINTWQYYQFLRKEMIDSFDKFHIDEALVLAIMAQESGGKVHSRSRAGAGGLFQLMPATAKRLGLHGKSGAYDLRFNPKHSAGAAAKYIKEQLNLYDGDRAKILAAYNSGETRFARLNRQHKNKSIWGKSFFYELPRETRHYVPVVIAAMLIFQDPEKFNVTLNKIDSTVIKVQLPNETSLSELAVCLGQEQRSEGWFRVLRNLNSGVKADKSIKANTDLIIPKVLTNAFSVNCLNNDLMNLAKSLHDSDFKGNQGIFRYKVKQGDSLSRIVKKFRCTSKKELARLNHLKAPRYLIRAGKYLKVPQC